MQAIHRAVFISLTFIEQNTEVDHIPQVRKIKPLFTLTHQVDGNMVRGLGFGVNTVKLLMLWLALWTMFKPGAADIWQAWITLPCRVLDRLEVKFYELVIIKPLVIWFRSLIYLNYATASC